MTKTVEELALALQGTVEGDGSIEISDVTTLEQAGPGHLSFLANARYAPQVMHTKASAVLVPAPVPTSATQIVVKNPYYAFTRALVLFHGHRMHPPIGVSPEARVDPTAILGEGCNVHAGATISSGAVLGRRCTLYPGVFLGRNVVLGDDCVLYPNVVVYEECRLGARVQVHANSTIGQDGLGYSTEGGVHHKIPHIARAILEDDVEIGANSGVERGSLQDTVIREGSKIGSQVVIGHGVQVGAHGMIVAQTGIAGSTRLGHHCVLAGQSGVGGHLEIGNHVTVAAKSGVNSNVPDGQRVFGYPAYEMDQAVEAYATIRRLPELRRLVRSLEKRVKALEAQE